MFFFSGGLSAREITAVNHIFKGEVNARFEMADATTESATNFDFVVKGTVRDASGPLQGATITEKGTSRQATTNAAGQYSINASGPKAV
jgi:hypothetical protein